MLSTQNRSASVIGYRVDEERQKMVAFADNEVQKCKSNKKILHNTFTGRLMRPTQSSNIRVVTNIKIKEKEKSKNKEKHGTWTFNTKCQSDDLKHKTSWLDALATPRRGPSRCQGFEKLQSAKTLNLIKKQIFISQNFPKRVQIGEKYQEKQKNITTDAPKVCQHNSNIKLHNQNQGKIDSKLNDEKSSRNKIKHVPKRTTKTNVYEYDIFHVEERLAERLKQGANRRLACLHEIKGRVTFVSQGDKYNKPCTYRNFWKIDGFLNQQSLQKSKEILGNVDDLYARFKGITFYQKQAMKKKVRNVRLKLANKKVEFPEPPLGIEAVGIGSATTTGAKNFQNFS